MTEDGDSETVSAAGGKYVYCIIRLDRSREFGEIGIGGGAVQRYRRPSAVGKLNGFAKELQ